MSLGEDEVSPRRVAPNQSGAEKSTGPKTPEGKARIPLNALKTDVHAKVANVVGTSFGSPLSSSGRESTIREAEGGAEGTATDHKTAGDGAVAAKNEKIGQSNLTSAAQSMT